MGHISSSSDKKRYIPPYSRLSAELASGIIPAGVGSFSPTKTKEWKNTDKAISHIDAKDVGKHEIRKAGKDSVLFAGDDIRTAQELRRIGFTPEQIIEYIKVQKENGVKTIREENIAQKVLNRRIHLKNKAHHAGVIKKGIKPIIIPKEVKLVARESEPIRKDGNKSRINDVVIPSANSIKINPEKIVPKKVMVSSVVSTPHTISMPSAPRKDVVTKNPVMPIPAQTKQEKPVRSIEERFNIQPAEKIISKESERRIRAVEIVFNLRTKGKGWEEISQALPIKANTAQEELHLPSNLHIERLHSWRDEEGIQKIIDFVSDITTLNEEQLITKYVPTYVVNVDNPSLWSSISNFSAYEIINGPEAVYGLTTDRRLEISSLIKNLGTIDETISREKYNGGKYVDYKGYILKNSKLTIHEYYEHVRRIIAQADTKK